jgi:Na+/H+ antiporter NhaB
MKQLLQEIGFNIGISVAGFFGSLILIGKKQSNNLKTTFFAIVTGVASANYITPIIVDILRMDEKYQMSVAFILGFLGVKGVEFVSSYLLEKSQNANNKPNK